LVSPFRLFSGISIVAVGRYQVDVGTEDIRLEDRDGDLTVEYDFIAIPDTEIPQAAEPLFQHVVTTYASEANKTVSVWRAVPDDLLEFQPQEKTNPIRTILVHQLLSERRFFAQFIDTEEPPVEELLPPGDKPVVQAYISKYIWLAKGRLPQLAAGTTSWWLESRPFFGGLRRERIWVFWRRVLHTCHHRTQVQTWLRLADRPVPAISGPSGDVTWDEADPTYSSDAAQRGPRERVPGPVRKNSGARVRESRL
jgi:uncharacterized damage-inducible protein DinB